MKVALDVGFEREEVNQNVQGVDLADSQQHVATIKRFNKGRSIIVYVSCDSKILMFVYAR